MPTDCGARPGVDILSYGTLSPSSWDPLTLGCRGRLFFLNSVDIRASNTEGQEPDSRTSNLISTSHFNFNCVEFNISPHHYVFVFKIGYHGWFR